MTCELPGSQREDANMAKNVTLAVALPARPDRLFDMYLDAAEHAAFTGMPVTLEPHAGGVFRAFDGRLSGTDFTRRAEDPDRADLALRWTGR